MLPSDPSAIAAGSARGQAKRTRQTGAVPLPYSGSALRLPLPDASEIQEFRDLYRHQFGVDLPYREATTMLTDMVQFYFLTKGHELYERNERIRRQQERRA